MPNVIPAGPVVAVVKAATRVLELHIEALISDMSEGSDDLNPALLELLTVGSKLGVANCAALRA